jgi:putative acetyltransferase
MKIRAFKTKDIPAVRRLWQSTPGVEMDETDSASRVHAFLRWNKGMSLLAEDGEKIVAAVLCGHDARRGYMHHLTVAAGWRGQGIGTELIRQCVRKLRKSGISRSNIFLFTRNRPGKQFWRRKGWAERKDICLFQKRI